ncbi:hypothetical protein C8K36_10395 [Rhodococcus sp. OK519]|nr:hypothetical protein C8K36_10395 [Rhodococcus sp. OK519]
MELRTNGSIGQPALGAVRPNMLPDLDLGRSNSVGTALWWFALMLMVAAVPAVATVLLMGSVTLALTVALITLGGLGLAALMI